MAAVRLLLEGVPKSPEAQERLLNGIVDFCGVTEEERGCAVGGRVPLLQEFFEFARIGVGDHALRRYGTAEGSISHLSRYDIARQLGLQMPAMRRAPEFLEAFAQLGNPFGLRICLTDRGLSTAREILLVSYATMPSETGHTALSGAADHGVEITILLERTAGNSRFATVTVNRCRISAHAGPLMTSAYVRLCRRRGRLAARGVGRLGVRKTSPIGCRPSRDVETRTSV